MSVDADELKEQMLEIQKKMRKYGTYSISFDDTVTAEFHSDVNLLLLLYGKFIGEAKSKYQDRLNELTELDKAINGYFELLLKTANNDQCLKLVNLAVGKMSELIFSVETWERAPPNAKVSKEIYDKIVRERDELRKTVEIMVQYKGVPELNNLLETARNIALPVDEYWVLALCSSNLIEAIVNKKLEKLGEKAEGSFEERYKKLCRVIKEKEKRDISQLLPSAVYKVRNKLDHASDANRVTPKEAKDISKMVIEFMNEIFP